MRRLVVLAVVWAALVACTADPPPAPPVPSEAGLVWRQLAVVPTSRTEVAAAADGPLILVAGGYTGDGATVATVEVLDTTTQTWTAGPDLPVAVNHAMAATVDDTVYVFGGYEHGNVPSRAAFRLEPSGWRRVADLPTGVAAGTAVEVGGIVYLAGGIVTGGTLSDRTLVYDVAADRWSTAAGLPTPREHLGGAGFGGLVYTVGGRTAADGNLTAFEVFDPRTGDWALRPDLPTRRGGLAAAATCNGQVIAVGGEAQETFAEAEAFDVASGTWRSLPDLPTPRHGLGVVAIGPTLYTLAGGPHPGLHVAGATEAIDLSTLGPCS